MATPAELEAVVVLAIDEALTDPQITQVSEVNPIEQDLRVSSEDMQPDGLRQRVIHGHSDNSSSQQGDGPINSEERLTPISNAGTKQTQVEKEVLPVKRLWYQRLWYQRLIKVKSRTTPDAQEEQEYNKKYGFDRMKKETVDNFPMGFPKLAALQNSDDDLVIMRAFHHLNIRFLIEDEVEITRLEEELQRLDEVDAAIKATRYKLKTINQDDSESKAKIKKELRQKLGEYRDNVLEYSKVRALGKCEERDHRAMHNWMWKESPLREGYRDFIFHEGDFVPIVKRTEKNSTFIEDLIRSYVARNPESFLTEVMGSPKTFLRTDAEKAKSSDPKVRYISNYRLDTTTRALVVCISVSCMLIPIFILRLVPMPQFVTVLLVLLFVSIFATTMSVITDSRTQDILVGSAAYTAVAVAVLGNIGFPSGIQSQ